ncbi:intermembrane transport protein PqiB [Aliidiomarina celeris]|uniref:intermembrane transport protein PqiB n=1 Tax=Aliidiomarina celeris TaxID=2249428 RepID=UPI000DE96E38|nr:intermembrane transport protein PqiB [Aliidiomarina celeris]
MSSEKQPLVRAERQVSRRISSVWLVPIVALAIGVWMAYDTITSRGPLVTIEVDSAEGIEAGKTLVKAQDVAVGRVESVRLSAQLTSAIVEVRMYQDTERLLNSGTEFWVVKPRVGREGISGLTTLLSGAFIQLEPGQAADNQRRFVALDTPPITPSSMQGVRIELQSADAGMLGVGDPVLFRGYRVGRVERIDFDPEERHMNYQVFVQAPYDQLVTENVRFWMSAGAKMDLDSQGVRVEIGSLESLIGGGVSFAVFDGSDPGPVVAQSSAFELYGSEEDARQARFTEVVRFIVLFEDSVRGLNKGSPVEYKGVRVGTVEQVPYRGVVGSSASLLEMKIPVVIRIEPERLGGQVNAEALSRWQQQLPLMFQQGLRASLRAGNLLTGALFVDLNFYPDEPLLLTQVESELPLFPSVTNSFTQLDQKLTALLDSLNNIRLSEFVDTATQTLENSEATLAAIANASEQLSVLLAQEDMLELPSALVRALDELERTFAGYSIDAPAYNELTRSIERLNSILRDLEPFGETLRDSPRALFFDTEIPADPPIRRNP